MTDMEKLLHHYRNAPDPQIMADKVLAAIRTLGSKWIGRPINGPEEKKSTFEFKRSGGMFSSEVGRAK